MTFRHHLAIDWAPLNRDFLRLVDEGVCLTEMARRLGVSSGALSLHAQKNNVVIKRRVSRSRAEARARYEAAVRPVGLNEVRP